MMDAPTEQHPKLLLVDDEPDNLLILEDILHDDYEIVCARNGEEALALTESEDPDLIILDIGLPGLSGYDVCVRLKAEAKTQAIPVIFVTAMAHIEDEAKGFELGAVDYITKPVSGPIVRARVRTHLSLVRMDELQKTRLKIIQRLGRAAEFKDNETGMHVIRMSHYSRLITLGDGLGEETANQVLHAAPMHDIGKIGIPDAILQKPAKLSDSELIIMRRHAEMGAAIIGDDDSPLLQMARRIALSHHERWDGNGYPHGLAGEEIPIEARIVAIADVFDALTSDRPYKSAWSVEAAVDLIRSESGTHFDPSLVKIFIENLPAIIGIRERWPETQPASEAISHAM
jgi:cyclic di-GMP phosphodiesterase